MTQKLIFILAFCMFNISVGQECPLLINPQNGDINVPVNTIITWEDVTGVTGYIISIGTTEGGTEVINQRNVGSATSFTPPLGLPDNSEIFVTISLFFLNQPNIPCPSESFTTEDITTPPQCTVPNNIIDGQTGVSIFTNISWDFVPGATSYRVTVGTLSNAGDIADIAVTGLNFNIPGELDPNRLFFVRITPINENGAAQNCTEITFVTGEMAELPECTRLISPANGDTNVPLTPLIEWEEIPGATGYRVTIGTSPTDSNILNNTTFFTTSTFVIDFDPNRTFFITIIPFNNTGDAIGCIQESFSTLLGCGPFFDPVTGELVMLNPELIFDNVFAFCENEGSLELTAPAGAEGYRWYSINNFGAETLLVEGQEISITENSLYRLEAFNTISQSGSIIECPTSVEFEVVSSEIPVIDNLLVSDTALGLEIIVEVSGNGNYEYAIDDINGPYQDSNIFNAVTPGTHTFFVRDRNGCGIAQETFVQDLTVEGFPKFFTPNGDGTNDFWQFIQPVNGETIILNSIRIYDRFGKFLKEITQNSIGWDGNFNGRPLPSDSYWFRAVDGTNREIQGFFALKR